MNKVFSPSVISQLKRDARRKQKREPDTPLCSILDRLAADNGFANWFALQSASKKAGKEDTHECKKCGSHIAADGYCSDETCPFSDWPQSVGLTDLYEMAQSEVEAKYGVHKAQHDRDYEIVMRSKTTFGTDSQCITVHRGQNVSEVAERIADGYGATVESIRQI